MAFYEGDTLKKRIEEGPLPIADALDIAIQISQELAKAHAAGIVHRDIKPANVMITKDGFVKIVDFGVAKLLGVTGPTQTGTTLGTVSYMSPEQVAGEDADQQSDVWWSLGAVLYELLTGRQAFRGDHQWAVMNAVTNRNPESPRSLRDGIPEDVEKLVERALEKPRDKRFWSAAEFLQAARACQAELTRPAAAASIDPLKALRKPRVAIPAVALLIALVAGALWAWSRTADARWAREEAIPEIARLAEAEDYVAAYALAEEAERYIPDDPVLSDLWPTISASVSIRTAQSGADVYVREYSSADGDWTHLGQTSLDDIRLPRGLFQWRIEKAGFQPLVIAAANPSFVLGNIPGTAGDVGGPSVELSLIEEDVVPPGMVQVPGGTWFVDLNGFLTFGLLTLDPFLIDQHEVTNEQFKEFVDGGGYENAAYWEGLEFSRDGQQLSWQEAMSEFVDSTGRPGPATWELGDYPNDQGRYPVTGVSWYEAAAYASFRGRALPTLFHWARAATSWDTVGDQVPLSNFEGAGSAPVGSHAGLGPYGTYDTVGNVREWVSNSAGTHRWILGGAWSDRPTGATAPTCRRSDTACHRSIARPSMESGR